MTRLVTRPSLAAELRSLGLGSGDVLLVHSSLSALGFVNGGALAVVQALQEVIGPDGTLLVPTHAGDHSDPAEWRNPPVPEEWWDEIRRTMPPFDPAVSTTRAMGAVADCVRTFPGARRSAHPQTSFAAIGPQAAFLTDGHELGDALGETSPLARLYDLDGWVLLLGVGHANNTSLHLAEYRLARRRIHTNRMPVALGVWKAFEDVDLDESDFETLGAAIETDLDVRREGPTTLLRQRPMVDAAVRWMDANR
jgi:aminoglycoside 3-N-acetyltransferase